jgi:PST family polysaccharide transporter
MSTILVFKSTDAIKCWFEAEVESRYAVWAENAAFIISGIFKIYLIFTESELIYFASAVVIESILSASFLILLYTYKGRRLNFPAVSYQSMLALLKNSWPLLLSNVAIVIYMRIDLIMLDAFSGAHEVGLYSAATRISESWYFIPMIICSTLAPSVIRAHAGDSSHYIYFLGKLYFTLFWLASLITALFIICSEPLIMLLYGPKYSGSAVILAIHSTASIAVFLGVGSAQYLLTENLQKISLYRTACGATINILLNLLLIPKYGATGAAIGTTISYYISFLTIFAFKASRPHAKHIVKSPFLFGRYLNFRLLP